MRDVFVNPFTDFGFKKIFGEESNKDLLIDFLNEILPEKAKIISLTYLKNEQLGVTQTDRKAIYDLYCENERGEKFIVELQKAKQKFFKDRSLYYTTFAIQEQANAGDWDYRLKAVYAISIMDFNFDDTKENSTKFRHDVKLVEIETNQVFYDKLHFIYLEMPKFNKTEAELVTNSDKWLYVLKNLARLEDIPPKLQARIFKKLFQIAAVAKFNPAEQRNYQDSLKYYRDLKNSMDTALELGREEGYAKGLEEGREKGREEGKRARNIEIAEKMLTKGVEIEAIIELTGLDEETVKKLQK